MKYFLRCTKCGKEYASFADWFNAGQKCACGCARAEAVYPEADYSKLGQCTGDSSIEKYFDYLPLLSRDNIVTCSEGAVPIEHWPFLEAYAREKYGIDCSVEVVRNDLNGGTGTFKDIAAALAASLFKENGVGCFSIASTGNTATAFAHYLAKAGVGYTVFVPEDVSPDTVEAIHASGQTCRIHDGDYGGAKAAAAAFAKENCCLISAGNIDPIRVESKRTLVFELLQHYGGTMPDYYFQAVAGGTCPIAIDKAVRELCGKGMEVQYPAMMMVQQDTCDPMVRSWEKAEAAGFPEGFEKEYDSVEPHTFVSILSNGIPGMYPLLAPIAKKSGGCFIRVAEERLVDCAKWVRENTSLTLGPASIVCIEGFLNALRDGKIKSGSKVLLNYGEGCGRNRAFAAKVEA